jgi:hypothetical protein
MDMDHRVKSVDKAGKEQDIGGGKEQGKE